MTVTFRHKKLRKQYEHSALATQAYGEQVARKYIQRIQIMLATQTLDELLRQPGIDCHPLKGDRAGQYAVKLTGFFRLIFTVKRNTFDIICIEEVSKHYGN